MTSRRIQFWMAMAFAGGLLAASYRPGPNPARTSRVRTVRCDDAGHDAPTPLLDGPHADFLAAAGPGIAPTPVSDGFVVAVAQAAPPAPPVFPSSPRGPPRALPRIA